MLKTRPALPQLQATLRSKVCADCPWRKCARRRSAAVDSATPATCESSCPLFVCLPVIRDVACQADPMIGRPRRAIEELVDRITQTCGPPQRPTRLIASKAARVLASAFGY